MRIIKTKTLKEFYLRHPQAEQPIKAWVQEAKEGNWGKPDQIKKLYRSADFIKGNRVIFNISGNKFRLIVQINYKCQVIYVRFIGTHSEYDKIDAETVNEN